MTIKRRRVVSLGDLVVAAFDDAATFSTDPQEVSRLATVSVRDLLRWAPRPAAAEASPKAGR